MDSAKQFCNLDNIIAFGNYKVFIKILKLYGKELSNTELLKKLQKLSKK